MKQKIAVLTDSSSSIYKVNHNFDNLFMIDIPCFIGDEVFTDFAKNKDDAFYKALKNTSLVPKTSQPSIGETLEKFEKIKSLGFTHLIYLPISKELSGTYQNGYMAKDMVEGLEVTLVDTKTTVSILGGMALEAARLAKMDHNVEEIISKVLKLRANSNYYVTVNDLTSLVKNGRLSNAKSFVANLLRIKPVIQLNAEGKIVSIENVRTFKGSIKKMIDYVQKDYNPMSGVLHISYAGNDEDLQMVHELLKERFPNSRIEIYTIPATVAAHTGLTTIGVGYINY